MTVGVQAVAHRIVKLTGEDDAVLIPGDRCIRNGVWIAFHGHNVSIRYVHIVRLEGVVQKHRTSYRGTGRQQGFIHFIIIITIITTIPDKCKIMKIGKWNDTGEIIIGGKEIETVDDFCYLGRTLTDDSSCNQEIRACIGKANAAFGKLEKIWKSNGCGVWNQDQD